MKSKSQNLTLVSVNILCILSEHDFDSKGRCKRKAPNLFNKNAKSIRCGGRK